MLPRDVQIRLRSQSAQATLRWERFDGDDCFEAFSIEAQRKEEAPKQFDFGGCVVWGLRRTTRFLADNKESKVSGGFRNPDVRTYEWTRDGDGIRLMVRYEGSGLLEEFVFKNPEIEIDRTFIDAYDGEG